jgi:hypothetical protein
MPTSGKIRKRCNVCNGMNTHYKTKKIMCVKCLNEETASTIPLKKRTLSDLFHSPGANAMAMNLALKGNKKSKKDTTGTTDDNKISIVSCESCRCITVSPSKVYTIT